MSVVGFDDIPEAPYLIPPLTTVRQDFKAVGHRAIEILQAAIAGDPAARAADRAPSSWCAPAAPHPLERTEVEQQMPDQEQYVVGVDFGTLSGRAVVVRVSDGAELGTARPRLPARRARATALPAVAGAPLPPDWALQVPEDYREVLRVAVPAAVAAAGIDPAHVIGIATDFTACTMVPTLADGTPLCELRRSTPTDRTPT